MPQVGDVSLVQRRAAGLLVQDEGGGHAVEHGECLQLGADVGRVPGEHGQDVLKQGDAVGADHRTGDYQPGEPGVTQQVRACLLADGHQVTEPVAARRR